MFLIFNFSLNHVRTMATCLTRHRTGKYFLGKSLEIFIFPSTFFSFFYFVKCVSVRVCVCLKLHWDRSLYISQKNIQKWIKLSSFFCDFERSHNGWAAKSLQPHQVWWEKNKNKNFCMVCIANFSRLDLVHLHLKDFVKVQENIREKSALKFEMNRTKSSADFSAAFAF